MDALKLFEPGTLVSILFILAALHIFLGDSTGASTDLFLGNLGLLAGIPILLAGAVAHSSFSLFTPVLLLAVLWFLGALRAAVGEGVAVAILASWLLISLGV